ncbi:UNVERIFIED_CONTAM: hypothetical protein Slati_0006200 [Sesamum latifolium]|uniref:Retrotransposon gag domain-containing protein n=1 Tax=Sesamum latifolium TaxID=2727402 RepID=A0AAW2Y5U4_9LAMI
MAQGVLAQPTYEGALDLRWPKPKGLIIKPTQYRKRRPNIQPNKESLAPARVAILADVEAPEEEAKEAVPAPVPPTGRRLEAPAPVPKEGLQDVQHQIGGAPEDERLGIPFTEAVMTNELPMNWPTPAIAEYDGTTDPVEHLAHFENATLLHRYTNGIKCRVFVTTFARAAQQWFNQLPTGQRTLERISADVQHCCPGGAFDNQEVKASAFSQGLLDGDFFKSLAKKPISKFDALLARAAKYINMEDAQATKKKSRGEKRK